MNSILAWFLALLFAEFALDWLATSLNLRAYPKTPPAEVRTEVPVEKFEQAGAYLRANGRFATTARAISLVALLLFLGVDGFAWADRLARGWIEAATGRPPGPITAGLLFGAILALLKSLISVPISAFHTFRIEARFGFNRTAPSVFMADLVKGALLATLIGGPIFAGIIAFFDAFGPSAWWMAWAGFTAVSLALAYLAPAVILPLFNKFSPLPEGPLSDEIARYARSQDFRLQGIYVMDGSKRSGKTNAFFTGFGRFRKLVLFDTLIDQHPSEEIVAVVAHEIGHFRLRHIGKSMALSLASSFGLFYLLSWAITSDSLAAAFGLPEPRVYAGLIFASLIFSPALRLVSFLPNAVSRRFEFEADAFAARTLGDSGPLRSALKRLSIVNLSNLAPHRLKVWLDDSHPPVLARVKALEAPTPTRR